LSTEIITFLILGAAAGGFINGLSGTGTALFALGFYLVVLPPVTAVAVVAFMSVLVGLQGLWVVRKAIHAHPKRLARFVLPGLAGVPIGLAMLSVMDAGVLRVSIAVMLIIYGGYFAGRKNLPAFTRPTPLIDSVVGFLGGIFGGAASVSGAIPAMWLSIRPWPKAQTRAVLQPFNIAVLSTSITILFWRGAFDGVAQQALLVTVPCGLIAAQLGIWVFGRLSDVQFRQLLIVLTFLMGAGILLSEVV